MATLSIISPGLNYSDETLQLQKDLSSLGYSITIDGLFGPETQSTVMSFQQSVGIEVDGIVGPITSSEIQFALQAAWPSETRYIEQYRLTEVQPSGFFQSLTEFFQKLFSPTIPVEQWPSEVRYVEQYQKLMEIGVPVEQAIPLKPIELQQNLNQLGFPVMVDGIVGPETRQATKEFQQIWGGLDIDGIAGPLTSAAIYSAIGLLNEGQWNPSTDPMQATPTTTTGALKAFQTEQWPSETRYIEQYQQLMRGEAEQAGLFAGIEGIDWKWILLGIGIVMIVTQATKKR